MFARTTATKLGLVAACATLALGAAACNNTDDAKMSPEPTGMMTSEKMQPMDSMMTSEMMTSEMMKPSEDAMMSSERMMPSETAMMK